jgi:Right handed beta helix region
MHPERWTAALLGVATFVFVALVGLGTFNANESAAVEGRTLHVRADHATLESAIAASRVGDVILLAAGTYPGDIVVPDDKPGITIRGEDRNTVVFDGANTRANAIEVEADDVTLENMSAHSYTENGFYWDGVEGFAGRYLTVWNVGLYAIYAIESRDGVIEHSYASGAADAAFYIGECNPCNATLRNLTAVLSAVGYSGTNAGGNLVVEDSRFENNSIGILPNSFEVGLEPPPQRDAIFRGNVVTGSGSVPTPRATPLGGYHGIGIGVAGGVGNTIEGNQVTGSSRYGIAVFTAIDFEAQWVPSGNAITSNTVSGSGLADLALAAGSGANNCFTGNTARVLLPADLATACSVEGSGDATVASNLVLPPPQLLEGLPVAPDYSTMPAPPAQPTMPAAPGVGDATMIDVYLFVGGVAIAVLAVIALGWFLVRRSHAAARPT